MPIVSNVPAYFKAGGAIRCQGKLINCSMDISKVTAVCPDCGVQLIYRDSRPRIVRRAGGKVYWCMVPRMICPKCHRCITVLPSNLSPYKHYSTDTIEDVIDGSIDEYTPEAAESPSLESLRRWRRWFRKHLRDIQGLLGNVEEKRTGRKPAPDFGEQKLRQLKKRSDLTPGFSWLSQVMILIYAFGFRLPPLEPPRLCKAE